MKFIDSIRALFGGRPSLPPAPVPSESAKRIFLRNEALTWKSMNDVKTFFGDRVKITNRTVDLMGAVLSGKKLKRSGNSQNENAPAVTIAFGGLVLCNGWVDDIPGGIVVKESYCSFEKLKFINIGEDAVSTVGEDADGIRISGCEFWNAGGDKSIQLNQAFAAIISDTRIVGGITGIRVQKDSYLTTGVNCILRGVTFEGCETGINVAGRAVVRLQSPTFKNVKKKWVTGNGCKVIET